MNHFLNKDNLKTYHKSCLMGLYYSSEINPIWNFSGMYRISNVHLLSPVSLSVWFMNKLIQ